MTNSAEATMVLTEHPQTEGRPRGRAWTTRTRHGCRPSSPLPPLLLAVQPWLPLASSHHLFSSSPEKPTKEKPLHRKPLEEEDQDRGVAWGIGIDEHTQQEGSPYVRTSQWSNGQGNKPRGWCGPTTKGVLLGDRSPLVEASWRRAKPAIGRGSKISPIPKMVASCKVEPGFLPTTG